MKSQVMTAFVAHQNVIASTAVNYVDTIVDIGQEIIDVLHANGTIFWCGNGGSAADSQHLAAELVGRFKGQRMPLRSIALSADSSVLTSISNDDGYEEVFARQLRAYAQPSDLLVVISTSGESVNIIRALEAATALGLRTVGLLGMDGGKALALVDHSIVIPSADTARIQEAHILVGHCLCELIDSHFSGTA